MSAGFFAQHFPKLGPHLTDCTPYTTNLHVFLRPWLGSMNIIFLKILGPMNLIKIPPKMPTTCEGGGGGGGGGGGCCPPFRYPPLLCLVGDARRNLTKFLSSSLKVIPRPSEAFRVSFWTDEKPYKCIGSK